MERQNSQTKLTRTQSSLLRSPTTARSSIQNLSSIAVDDLCRPLNLHDKNLEEKQKPKPGTKSGSPFRTRYTRVNPFTAIASLSFFTLFSLTFFFFYLRREEIPASETLLLALIFIAVTLFFASKNKKIINQTVTVIKQLRDVNTKRFAISSKNQSKHVQWFIGESKSINEIQEEEAIVREGVEVYTNGDIYEGEFHKGKCNGSGVYNYLVNGRYEGEWIEGRYDGHGIESWARGSRYKGQYKQGLRHGFGIYRFYTGDSYAGEWWNGQSHGFGVQTCADGSCYVGEFKRGVKHGLGCYHFRNGDRYAGEYFADKIHGFGSYHFANGHCYEGSWHEGRKQGYGMYSFRNGDPRCGEWHFGSLKTPLPPITDIVVRAVQAGRRTAGNALSLERNEEEVKKAVKGANRAATAARVAAVKAVQNQMDGKVCDAN